LISNIDAIPFYKFAYQILIAQGLGDTHTTYTHSVCAFWVLDKSHECVCVFLFGRHTQWKSEWVEKWRVREKVVGVAGGGGTALLPLDARRQQSISYTDRAERERGEKNSLE